MDEIKDTWKKIEEKLEGEQKISRQPPGELPKNFVIRFVFDQKEQKKSISFEFKKILNPNKKFRSLQGYEVITKDAPGAEDFMLLNINLLDQKYDDIFKDIISVQLVRSTENCKTDIEAVKNLVEKIKKINDFFRYKNEGLSKQEMIGVFGELVFLNGSLRC